MKAKKVVIEFGATPAECAVIVDGKKLTNVGAVDASITMEEGPVVTLHTNSLVPGGTDQIIEVEFDAVIEDAVNVMKFSDLK